MDISSIGNIGLLMGSSWASGVNLYLTVAGLGIAHRLQWITLPGEMDSIAHPVVIGIAVLLYLIEFFADKVPYIDSVWDSIHTFIRPVGGSVLGYLAMSDAAPAIQYPIALLTGAVALDAHLTKATSRIVINTSPEPVTNSLASAAEDITVLGALYLIISHPLIVTILVVLFIIFSIWFLVKMIDIVKTLFRRKEPKSSSS